MKSSCPLSPLPLLDPIHTFQAQNSSYSLFQTEVLESNLSTTVFCLLLSQYSAVVKCFNFIKIRTKILKSMFDFKHKFIRRMEKLTILVMNRVLATFTSGVNGEPVGSIA